LQNKYGATKRQVAISKGHGGHDVHCVRSFR